jgi:hypothetical protein
MQTRTLVVAIALVLALAVAAPTIGATQNRGAVASQALDISKEAREIAKSAKRTANKARGLAKAATSAANGATAAASSASNKADTATTTANGAATKADAASTAAAGASAKADAVAADLVAAKIKSASANGAVSSTNDTSYEDLGGPSVAITVPASGLIEVWAQATISDGAVSLFEDGQQVSGQDPNEFCSGGGTPPPGDALLAQLGGGGSAALSTPSEFNPAGCGSLGPPGSVLFKTSPGDHTYSLRYAWCSCGSQADFSDRFLAVAPKP